MYQTPIANQDERISKEIIEEVKRDLPDCIVNTMTNLNRKNLTTFEQEIKKILNENYITNDRIIYVKK